MTKIGFTGTQLGMTDLQKTNLHYKLIVQFERGAEFHHGDCIGSDEQAHAIAKSLGYWIVIHPPTNPEKRAWSEGDEFRPELPYLDRNHNIVDETELLLAAPAWPETLRSGTWATIRYARLILQEVIILERDL